MGRRITVGIGPESFGSFTIANNVLSNVISDGDIELSPLGNGTVELPANYLTRTGVGSLSVMPKAYMDSNITPGLLFINLN